MIYRIFFLMICLLATLPAHAERYSSGGEALFVGALQGLFLMFVVWVWKLIKGSKSKTKETQSKNRETTPSEGMQSSLGLLEAENAHSQVKVTASSKAVQPSLSPWEKFKAENVELANNMESLNNEDFHILSEKDIFEKVATFKRMSRHFECPITELKDVTTNIFVSKFDFEELRDVIDQLTIKSEIESQEYSISEENTMSYYIQVWLSDYLYKASNVQR